MPDDFRQAFETITRARLHVRTNMAELRSRYDRADLLSLDELGYMELDLALVRLGYRTGEDDGGDQEPRRILCGGPRCHRSCMIPFVANEATFAASAGAEYPLIGFREAGRLVACVRAHFSGDTAEFLQLHHRHGFRQTHATQAAAHLLAPLTKSRPRRPGAFSSRLGYS